MKIQLKYMSLSGLKKIVFSARHVLEDVDAFIHYCFLIFYAPFMF